MSVGDKTRRILWAKAGGRCAICKRPLIENETESDPHSVVGEEAHIVSGKPTGPRSGESIACGIDDYDNLLLLCRVHHKMADDQPNTYTKEYLIQIKKAHESWVNEKLNEAKSMPKPPAYLQRVTTGQELFAKSLGTLALKYSYDEPTSSEQAKTLTEFLGAFGEVMEYNIYPDLSTSQKMELNFEYTGKIKELENVGYWIFAGVDPSPIKSNGKLIDWATLVVQLTHHDSPEITTNTEVFRQIWRDLGIDPDTGQPLEEDSNEKN